MNKRVSILLTAFALLLLAPLASLAQQQQEPPTFIFVSEWAIPRAQWPEYQAAREKNAKPIFDRMLADGTIISWGMYTTVVHDESGMTHGTWYEATSIAALERVLGELLKLSPSPMQLAATKHRDYFFRSSLRRAKAASGSNAYLWVSAYQIKPGEGQEWRDLWDKYSKPLFEELLANGTISAYWVEGEQVHTDNPGWVYVVWTAPNADAVDKFFSAARARSQKRSAEENRAIGDAFAAELVAGTHRDYFARVTHYAQK